MKTKTKLNMNMRPNMMQQQVNMDMQMKMYIETTMNTRGENWTMKFEHEMNIETGKEKKTWN